MIPPPGKRRKLGWLGLMAMDQTGWVFSFSFTLFLFLIGIRSSSNAFEVVFYENCIPREALVDNFFFRD